MALLGSRLCSRLSLSRLSALGTNAVTHGIYSPDVASVSRLPLCRHYSSSKGRRGIGQYVVSKFRSANDKYEVFLKRRFPRFYQLYHTFKEGFKLLLHDAKDVHRIKMKMHSDGLQFKDLPYRELEKYRQFRRDILKAVPLLLISIPPFANYLALCLMYFFPRQLLVPYFWTPKQQVEFRALYHSNRLRQHGPVLRGLETTGLQGGGGQLQGGGGQLQGGGGQLQGGGGQLQGGGGQLQGGGGQLQRDLEGLRGLCARVQRGANPGASEVLAVRSLFSGPPLGIHRMSVAHMRRLSPLLFLTPRLPAFLVGRRLNRHAVELLLLDRALSRMGAHQLSEDELRQACYVRGLHSDSLEINQYREWLSRWLQVSSSLKDSEVSLLLHCMVFLSADSPTARRR